MDDTIRVWIDDPNPLFRLGLECCLRAPGFALAGASTGLRPEPAWDRLDILVLDLGERDWGWVSAGGGARVLGIIDGERRGPCSLLVRAALTPAAFLDALETTRSDDPGPGTPRSGSR